MSKKEIHKRKGGNKYSISLPHILSISKKYTKKQFQVLGTVFGFLRGLFCDSFRSLLSSIELVHGTRLEDPFFSSIKRVALVAGFHLDFGSDSTSGYKSVSAGTCNFRLCREFWVNIFHGGEYK